MSEPPPPRRPARSRVALALGLLGLGALGWLIHVRAREAERAARRPGYGYDLATLSRPEAQRRVRDPDFRALPAWVQDELADRAMGSTSAGERDREAYRERYGYRLEALSAEAARHELWTVGFFDRPLWMQVEILDRALGDAP